MPGTQFTCNGRPVVVDGERSSLLDALRDDLGLTSVKDGCSPQGQCGCCTVLVDGEPRVSCVTSVRRVAGREVTTAEGLDPDIRERWQRSLLEAGASQCGFCTPGIIVRLAALARDPESFRESDVQRALGAHLCRCTGWQTLTECAVSIRDDRGGSSPDPVDPTLAARRATIEGGVHQRVDAGSVLGDSGFADDLAPSDALVAMPDGSGGWVVAESTAAARAAAGRIQGRRPTLDAAPPLSVPEGEWAVCLATSWVEPGYLETDASWCVPGGTPASPLGNGGAFGGKVDSPIAAVARELADRHGRPVRVKWTREDAARLGPKRPPLAAGLRADGTGLVRVRRTEGIETAIRSVLPDVEVEQVDVAGPPTSIAVRAAGWAEAAVLRAALDGDPEVTVTDPDGGTATVVVDDGEIRVTARGGAVLDASVMRSYCIGAVHMALGWVTSEGLVVDEQGAVNSLTMRSFGIVTAAQMPHVEVELVDEPAIAPTPVSDACFAATAAAVWLHQGCPPSWPTRRPITPAVAHGAS